MNLARSRKEHKSHLASGPVYSPRRRRSRRARVSASSFPARPRRRLGGLRRALEIADEGLRRELRDLAARGRRDRRVARHEGHAARSAMLGGEALEQRVGVLGEANLERAARVRRRRPRRRRPPRARRAARRSSRARRRARARRRTTRRAGGCSRRRDRASATALAARLVQQHRRGDADVQRLDAPVQRDRDERVARAPHERPQALALGAEARARPRRRDRPPTSASRPRSPAAP